LNESDRRQLRRGMFDTRECRLLQPETDRGASPSGSQGVPASGLPQAIERLEAHGIAAYAIDLTRRELGIPAIRVLAPALQLEPCHIVGPRLARMIDQTGGGATHHGGMPLL
jgi:ribosomal protein S12 methylthiotransferase accessory factor